MNKVRCGRPLIEIVKLCYGASQPVLLEGRHGIGKSEVIALAAKELGIKFISRDLSIMEPTDLAGLPRLDGKVTRFVPPAFLPPSGRGLLVFEELNRCPNYMRAPCLQLLTARTLNDYILPSGWLPVAAVNPFEDGYEVDELDAALTSRFVRLRVVADRDEWLDWAQRNQVHPAVIDYVRADATIFDGPDSNPRAWTSVSRLICEALRASDSEHCLRAAIEGRVGPERTTAFLAFWRQGTRCLSAEEIFAYRQHRSKVQKWVKDGKLDLAEASLLALQKKLQVRLEYDKARSNQTTWSNLVTFLGDLPPDMRAVAETFFTERGYDVPRHSRRSCR